MWIEHDVVLVIYWKHYGVKISGKYYVFYAIKKMNATWNIKAMKRRKILFKYSFIWLGNQTKLYTSAPAKWIQVLVVQLREELLEELVRIL